MNPSAGEEITITGTAEPGKAIKLRSSFQMDLPVVDGRYEYMAEGIEIPQIPNSFGASATNAKDINVGVKIIFWLTRSADASGKTASISQANVPPGRYTVRVFGQAADGVSVVSLKVSAETTAYADEGGNYMLTIDTTGIPVGEYRIKASDVEKIVHVGGLGKSFNEMYSESAKKSEPDEQKPSRVEITTDVIEWYAEKLSLDPKDPEQYIEAERLLNLRLSGGYWKVIARGDPMTEVCGNCQDEYCIVRVRGANTIRREKEMLRSSNNTAAMTNQTGQLFSPAKEMANQSEAQPREEKGIIEQLFEKIAVILGLEARGTS